MLGNIGDYSQYYDRNKIIFYHIKGKNNNNHYGLTSAQKKMIIKEKKERTEKKDKGTYQIALVCTSLSLIMSVKTLLIEVANYNLFWL
jgi:hypothetical protein